MSLEANGSVNAGNPDAAGAAVANSGSGDGAQTDWTNGLLGEGNRATVEAKGWKSPDDVIRSYRGLEGKLGEVSSRSLIPPGDDAKPEDWNAFYAKLGRPEKPDGYELRLPEGVPENLPYDGAFANEFKADAHEAGLTPKQTRALHDNYVKRFADKLKASEAENVKAMEGAHEHLVKAWGDPASESYKRNQQLADRTIRQQGGSELLAELKAVGALGANGEVKAPRLVMALARTGQSLYAEDTAYGGPAASGPNPFSDKSLNLTEQGRVIRSDPDQARALIRTAGEDPKLWGL